MAAFIVLFGAFSPLFSPGYLASKFVVYEVSCKCFRYRDETNDSTLTGVVTLISFM